MLLQPNSALTSNYLIEELDWLRRVWPKFALLISLGLIGASRPPYSRPPQQPLLR
jgi:integral membrane sensor domain MASE1